MAHIFDSMDQQLKELGKSLMSQMHDEYMEDEELYVTDVMDGMNVIEQLAVMFVTGTAGLAFERVTDEVGQCVVDNQYWFKD